MPNLSTWTGAILPSLGITDRGEIMITILDTTMHVKVQHSGFVMKSASLVLVGLVRRATLRD